MSRVQKVVLMLLPDSTTPPKTPSWMMGPACALRILAQNGKYCLPLHGDIEVDAMYYPRGVAEPHT